jgi:hypothetical protein
MKHRIVASAAMCSALCLTFVPQAEARSLRADKPGEPGCQLTNWNNPQSPTGSSPFTPGGVTLDTNGTDSLVVCTSNSDNTISTASDIPGTTTDANSFFGINSNNGSPYPIATNEAYAATLNANYLATGGLLYQFVSNGTGVNNAFVGNMDAEVVEWTLANKDTELELNGWCNAGITGASLTWGANTYTGGCNSSTQDLIFNGAGSLVGYVNDASRTLTFVSATTLPTDWSVSGAVSAPEIDPASAVGAFTMLAGCLVVLRSGRRTQGPAS